MEFIVFGFPIAGPGEAYGLKAAELLGGLGQREFRRQRT